MSKSSTTKILTMTFITEWLYSCCKNVLVYLRCSIVRTNSKSLNLVSVYMEVGGLTSPVNIISYFYFDHVNMIIIISLTEISEVK